MSFKNADLSSMSDQYFKPKDGVNKIRIVSEDVPIYKAFLQKANEEGEKALTFLTEEGVAAFHPKSDREVPKKLFGMWVIDRATGKFLKYECGTMVMKQLKGLANDVDYGFDTLPPYDIKLTKEAKEMTTKYTVMPSPASEITEDEKQQILGLESLQDFYRKEATDGSFIAPF